jgi:hypothetical protein
MEPITSGPNAGWNIGYNPTSVDITLDDITGGSSTFQFIMTFASGSTFIMVDNIPLSNGQTYSFDVTGGETVEVLYVENKAGGGDVHSITNIVFFGA